jgi:hypothetical protein
MTPRILINSSLRCDGGQRSFQDDVVAAFTSAAGPASSWIQIRSHEQNDPCHSISNQVCEWTIQIDSNRRWWSTFSSAHEREPGSRCACFINFDNGLLLNLTHGQAWFSFRLWKYGFVRLKNFGESVGP